MRGFALATLLAAAPLAAQTPGEAARAQREAAFDTFLTCTAAHPGAAAFALDSAYDGGFGRRHAAFRGNLARCAGSARAEYVRINAFLLRGGIARTAWMAGTPPPAAYTPPPPAGPAAQRSEALAGTFAACLLAKNRAAAEAFTRARSGSPEERAAFAPLSAHTQACAVDVPGAPTEPMGGDRLRAALALQLWAGKSQEM